MKQRYLNKVTARLGIAILLTGAVFIINSCRKESRLNSVLALSDSVNLAKTWYESTYPVTAAISGTLATQSVNNGQFDYSQHIKPDWQHAAKYNRFSKGVVELPVDPSAKFATVLTANTAGKPYYDKKNSKTSFVLLNDGKNYNAFIMTIMADNDYLANDTAKLAKNTYRHRDVNFSGMVFYFTPKGKFISSYRYKNGKIVPPTSQTTVTTNQQTQSIKVSSPCDVSNSLHSNSIKQVLETCQEWYWLYSLNGVVYAQSLAFTICSCDGGGASPPSGSGDECGLPQNQNSINSHLQINTVDGNDDDGFPDPNSCLAPFTLPFTLIYCNDLTSAQRSSIANQLANFSTYDCPSKYLAAYFVNQNISVCVSAISENAYYDPANNSFTYGNNQSMDANVPTVARHEFFHDFQHHLVTGGIAAYGMIHNSDGTQTATAGTVDIEFEDALFQDIANGVPSLFNNGTDDQKALYATWFNTLTSNSTAYPKIDPNSADYPTFISQYNSYLSQWNSLGGVYSSQVLNLTPITLINIFNNTNPNCP